MDALESVLSTPTAILAVCIAVVTLMVRRAIELGWPGLSKKTAQTRAQMVWEKLVLPTMPVAFCVAFCLLVSPKHFDYPAVALKSTLSRVLYGIGTGWFSDYGYRVIAFFLKKKWNIALPGTSEPPPPMPAADDEITKPSVFLPPNSAPPKGE